MQRLMNNLLRTRLYRSRMIWLLIHPLPLIKLTGGKGGMDGRGANRRRENLVLYNSFNTLSLWLYLTLYVRGLYIYKVYQCTVCHAIIL
jgi:hypothetical protein